MIGERLREARTTAGLTQTTLAEQAGMTQGWISDVERGERKPAVASLLKLADVLGVSLDWLAGGTSDPSTPPPPA